MGRAATTAAFLLWLLGAACRPPETLSPVHFAREEVALSIREGWLTVTASYHFQCTAPQTVNAGIQYPFPVDAGQHYPDSVVLHGRRFTPNDSGVYFPMAFRAGREDSFHIWYRQALRRNQARYIVTTTRQWRRPIDRAQFRIAVPATFRGVRLSFIPERAERFADSTVYYFDFPGFYPDRDIAVSWRQADRPGQAAYRRRQT